MNSLLSMQFKWILCGLGLFFEQMQSVHVWWAISELKGLQCAGYKEDAERSTSGLVGQCREIKKCAYVLWNEKEKATAEDNKNQILAVILRATGMHTQRIRTIIVYWQKREKQGTRGWEKNDVGKNIWNRRDVNSPTMCKRLGSDWGHVRKTTCEVD